MNNLKFRKLHRKIAPILFIPLFLTASTGVIYRLGRNWFGMSGDISEFFIDLHQGEILGEALSSIYVLLVGLGLIGLIVTGLTMIRLNQKKRQTTSKKSEFDFRNTHRILAPLAFLPLTVSALTGVAYKLGEEWFGVSEEKIAFLLRLHQASYLGTTGKAVYVLFIGLALLGLLITGIEMTGIFRKRRVISSDNHQ